MGRRRNQVVEDARCPDDFRVLWRSQWNLNDFDAEAGGIGIIPLPARLFCFTDRRVYCRLQTARQLFGRAYAR
jgi:hypothetical protein